MLYKNTIQAFILVVFCTIVNALTATLIQPPSLPFTPEATHVMTVEDWGKTGLQMAEISEALAHYHQSSPYNMTNEQFLENPHLYFDRRIQALDRLLQSIPKEAAEPALDSLRQQAENKRLYLKSLPDPLNPYCTLPEIHQLRKNINVVDDFWFEVMDPLHRLNYYNVYTSGWYLSEIPNYFIYLETVENHPLLQILAPLEDQMKYFYTEEERAPHQLSFKEGVIYWQGKPFDTKANYSFHSGQGVCIYVLGVDEEFYVNNHVAGEIHHSSEFAGGEIIGGGELIAENGKLLSISNKSGHYRPGSKDILSTLRILEKKYGSLAYVELDIFLTNGILLTEAIFNAQDFLNSEGRTSAIRACYGWSLLHVAVFNNYLEFSSQALSLQDLNSKEEIKGQTPLHLAAQLGLTQWVEILLDAGADPLMSDDNGNTPLHLAASFGHVEVMDILLPYHSDQGASALQAAIIGGQLSTVQKLIDKSRHLAVRDSEGNTIFHHAARQKHNLDIIQFFLNSKYSSLIHESNNQGVTALHYAARDGDEEMMHILLEMGLDPLKKDHRGYTILHYAVEGGNEDTTLFIIDKNKNFQDLMWQVTDEGKTAFHLAADKMSFKVLDKFLEAGMAVDSTDYEGNSPLYLAAASYSWTSGVNVNFFMSRNANPHLLNHQKQSVLHIAAQLGINKLIPILIHSHNLLEDLSLQDSKGNTPVHIAIQEGIKHNNAFYFDTLLLVVSEEIYSIQNDEGVTPSDLLEIFSENQEAEHKVG